MTGRFVHPVLVAAVVGGAAGYVRASEPGRVPVVSLVLQRFLSAKDDSPVRYRALRHMEATCQHFTSDAWMDVWTEVDAKGSMQYQIVGEGGSDYIRSKVFRAVLELEQKAVNSSVPNRAGITPENYVFEHGSSADDLASVLIKPRRKELLLVDGSIFLRPADGELVRIEGRLAKTPSFWVRRVDVVRHYQRFGGISMPVGVDSVANLLIAGRSTFRMSYDYESVNGQSVGNPQPKAIASSSAVSANLALK